LRKLESGLAIHSEIGLTTVKPAAIIVLALAIGFAGGYALKSVLESEPAGSPKIAEVEHKVKSRLLGEGYLQDRNVPGSTLECVEERTERVYRCELAAAGDTGKFEIMMSKDSSRALVRKLCGYNEVVEDKC
jgi:hypothetical protein